MAKVEKKELEKVEGKHGLSPFEEMDRMFDDYFSRGLLSPFRFEWPFQHKLAAPFEGKAPRVDLVERDDDILIKAELPGVDKRDLEISLTSTTVSIKGTTHHEEKEEKGDYYRSEISRGSYSRTLALPVEVDEEKAKATLKDGVLELTLPKAEKAKKRTVKIE
jgi:HSP20 family protein